MSEPLKLTGRQIKILREGIVSTYRNPKNLEYLLYVETEVQVSLIAGGDTYENKVFALIQDFEADGRIEEFIRVVVKDKPKSPYLVEIKKEFADILGELGEQDKEEFRLDRNSSQPRDGKWFAGVIGMIIFGVCVYILTKNPHLLGSSPISQPSANPEIPLVSSRGIDYTKLQRLLAQRKWKEADRETTDLLLRVSNREKDGWLRDEDVKNLSCEDLRTMDKLWVAHSNGKFGFSVQREIYQSLGGTSEYNEDVVGKFGERVGWRVNGSGININTGVTFDLNAKQGHLPLGILRTDDSRLVVVEGFFGVSLVKCNI